jgi:CHAT domain-containing protein
VWFIKKLRRSLFFTNSYKKRLLCKIFYNFNPSIYKYLILITKYLLTMKNNYTPSPFMPFLCALLRVINAFLNPLKTLHNTLKTSVLIIFLLNSCPLFAQNVSQDTLFAQMYRKLFALNNEAKYPELITEGEFFLAKTAVQDSLLLSYGNLLFIVGTGYYNLSSDDKSLWYIERALAIFTKLDHIRMADAYNRVAEYHYWYTQDYDTAIENCQKALAIHERKTTVGNTQKSTIYSTMGSIYTAQLKYSEALASYQKAFSCHNDDYGLAMLNMSLGDFYLNQSLYSKALQYFSKGEFHCKKFYGDTDHPNIAAAYGNEAICYKNMGAYAKAIDYYDKAKQIFLKTLGSNNPNILKAEAYKAFCYSAEKKYDEALSIFEKLVIEKNLDDEKGMKATVFHELGYCYVMKKEWKKFESLMPQLIVLADTSTFANLRDKAIIYRNIGVNFREAKNYPQATVFYQKAMTLMDSAKVKDEKTMNLILLELANNAFDQEKTDESIQYHEMVLKNISDKENKTSIEYYYTIYGLSLDYYQKFEKSADKTFLNKAIKLMDESVNIILALRNDYVEQADKQYLNSDGNIVFDKLIEMLLRKNALEPDSSLLKKCFILSEQNKSMRLLEAIKGIEIGQATTIMDSIKMVKLTINTLENQIYMAIKDSSKNQLDFWQAQLFEAKQEHERFVNTLKTQSEHYFKAIYQPEILSVESVQKLLNNDQTLLEYFVGDSSIFIFTINKDQYKITEVKKDFPLEQWIQQMRAGIYKSFLKNMPDSVSFNTTQYIEGATQLYDKLVAPVASILRGSVVIIPDGILGYVPFDALLMEKPINIARPQSFNYVLNKHKISYCYSATLLHEMIKKVHRQMPKIPFLVMVPTFSNSLNTNEKFNPLPYSREEAIRLQSIMGGDTIMGAKAAKDFFIQKAQNYRILHLSTHGKMDDKLGDYAYLAFAQSPKDNKNELLYTRELYNLSLNADMVVLSACETGVGELQRGEGIISLARAFAFAGSKSIVTTLWAANDYATKELMILFYDYLKVGKSKDEALWLAKRTYINNNKGELALPFFWSSIIPVGDMRPIGK